MSRNLPPLIITVALTGNVPTKEMNPNLPITPEEIAAAAIRCYKAGARVAHIHVRDLETQKPSQDLNLYRRVVKIMKKEVPDMVIQLTTGARCGTDDRLRMDVVRLCPEMGSFTTGSNNLAKMIYCNSPEFLLKLAKTYHDCGVVPEIECFDSGHIDNAVFLAKRKKLLQWPLHFNFVLGARGSAPGTVKTLEFMRSKVPEGCTWNCCGVGWCQFRIVSAAVAMGGHVRVGLEDMIFMPDGSMASNVLMVEKVVRIAKEMNRRIATPEETRKILNLNPKNRDRILEFMDKEKPLHPVDYSNLVGTREPKYRKGFEAVPSELWEDWAWQVENAIKSVRELKKYVKLSPEEERKMEEAVKKFGGIAIPPRLLVEQL